MSNIINADNGVVSGTAGVKLSSDSTGVLDIQTNGTTAITISTAQVVSLTNSPTFTGGTANGVLYLNASKVATSGSALVFDGTNFATTQNVSTDGTYTGTGALTSNGSNYLQWRYNDASGSSAMAMAKARGTSASPAAVQSGDELGRLSFDAWGGTTRRPLSRVNAGVEVFTSDSNISSNLTFHTSSSGAAIAAEKMRLDSSGNLGLGVTPSAWGSTFSGGVFQAKNASVMGYLNAVYLGANYYATNSTDNYIATGFASRYQQTSGQHQWLTAASGTAGNAITFTTAMTLTAAGEFLINTTTTTGNGKFTNSNESASLAGASSARIWNQIKNVAASNNATVDVWLGRDAAGNVIGNNFLVGHFNVFVIGASGANSFAGVYSIVTTGNGTSPATLSAVSTVTRGTSPVSSVQIAADGASGAIKLTITYINNAGVVTGGNSQVSFIGQII